MVMMTVMESEKYITELLLSVEKIIQELLSYSDLQIINMAAICGL
jgi:hypothetical protein